MTTTVNVRARAWGARVEVQGQEPVELGAHQERQFHIGEGESLSFTVTHGEQPASENAQPSDDTVPGQAENDRLLGRGSNESGATETSQTTDTPSGEPEATTGAGRRSRGSVEG